MRNRIVVLTTNDSTHPYGTTYPKRAVQLVKKGRAEWIDDASIRLTSSPPDTERATLVAEDFKYNQGEWIAYFRTLVEQVIQTDEATKTAVMAVADSAENAPNVNDSPGLAIAQIIQSNNEMKIKALAAVRDFMVLMAGHAADEQD